MKAVFCDCLKALGALPVEMALELTLAQESPPPRDWERHPALPLLPPTKVAVDDDLTTSSALPRPRDRKLKAEGTWKGTGKHGNGQGEALHPESVDEKESVDAGLDESLELLEDVVEPLDDVVDDQEEEDPELEGPRQRLRL